MIMLRVLALDPALNHTGWVLLSYTKEGKNQEGISALDYAIWKVKLKQPLGAKLLYNRQELTQLISKYQPDVIVMEETFAGKNPLAVARLNNAKGVYVVTAYEAMGIDPTMVNAKKARACLGFSNDKEEPFAFFKKLFEITEDFKNGNDITDACTVGFWYIMNQRNACLEDIKNKKHEKRSRKQTNKTKTD
jgi:Holliday junction resolvasome RuvABC endonuclease subunit